MPSGDIRRSGIRPSGKEESSRPTDAFEGLENQPRSRMLSVGCELTSIAAREAQTVVDGGSSDRGLSLVGLFLEFAEKLLAPARSFADVEGMPKCRRAHQT